MFQNVPAAAGATGAVAKRIGTLSQRQTLGATVNIALNSAIGRSSYKELGLNELYPSPEFPEPVYDKCETNISTLPNGLRVVSRVTNDPITNIGLFVNAGSRYCSPETSGVGHFLESCAVEGTMNINANRFQENLARTGSGLMVQAFRDAMLYQVETFNRHADFAMESIAELIWNPRLEDYRISKMKKEYLWRRGDCMKEAESEIPEYMHQAAYQGNTLGLPLYCDHHSIANISRSVIDEFTNVFYQPSRMICVGVGIDHASLERIASDTLGDLKNHEQFANIQPEAARYTGGQLKFKYEFENNDDTHISLIFETENWKSEDLMSLCVLNMIMGGGGSFSAGGPGKGMYTRLYREVLGTYHWINHISCSHSIFDDSGIFALYGCCQSEQSHELTSVMVREAINMLLRPPTEKEINRAKQALASNICFEFENRQIVFEDIARQVQVYGTHKTPEMWRQDIMNVSKDDILRVAKKLLTSNPTLLAMGHDVSRVPQQEEIKTVIKDAIA
eukprot:CAMPEP_0197047276 /NCGR_PEP_ID=MMETSP1384-20130603/22793_1 /TAXON_ID=29189 /ORGANISM="Ammonia sp." /LENGTH=505 /DNA_ID=CAMNT_0042479173 /DNA_START=97 /DNA_END=1614 /DNA_ORIENTATION=-